MLGSLLACGASPSPVPEVHRSERPRTSAAPTSPAALEQKPPIGRSTLVEPARVELPATILPADGGVVATTEETVFAGAGEVPLTWTRWLDERGRGAAVPLVAERLVGAFGRGDDVVLATSAGEQICVARFPRDGAKAAARGCEAARPRAVVRVGDRIALVDAFVERPPEPPKAAPAPPPRKSPAHGKASRKGRGKSGRAKGHGSAPPPRPPPKLPVDVRVRWVDSDGRFDAASTSTGLRFVRPQEGMTVIDAGGRPGGIDLLWFEWKKPPTGKPVRGLGRAAIVGGSLGADGTFDAKSTTVVAEGELQYGYVEGHMAPRLVTTERGSLYLATTGRGGPCEIAVIAPAPARPFTPAGVCAAAPWRLLDAAPPSGAESAALVALVEGARPRRTMGQPDADPERIAWGGGRGFFLADGKLRSLPPPGADGALEALREEAPVFEAHRSRIGWTAQALDGELVALVDGRIVHAAPDGTVASGASVQPPAAGDPASGRDEARAIVSTLGGRDDPGARRHAARIGASWWVARGDVVRAWPEPLAPAGLRRRGEPDSTALVGGARAGVLLELVGDTLAASALDADGNASPLSAFPSPVRVGFAATERGGGGALVVGTARADARGPSTVVAIAIGADGAAGALRATSLRLAEGEASLALTALPGGGALLTDAARTTAVWLDDDAREIAARPWPADAADAACPDGAPARRALPSPTPGRLVAIADYALPGTCVVGEPRWSVDGSLRWVGATVRGLDAVAHAGTLAFPGTRPSAMPTPTDPPARPAGSRGAPQPAPCPSDMALVASSLCVDRFEAMLVDATTGETLSADYPVANATLFDLAVGEWSTGRERVGDAHARAFPIPPPPPASFRRAQPRAVSRRGVRPSGYVSGVAARAACASAGKRLCTADELLLACRGQDDTLFPYGETWQDGACNVFRDEHPAALLHDNASIGHLDPRLDRVVAASGPLLRPTGATATCRSRWGADAIYDLVGNLDEWVDEPGGAFAGGFFSRSTRAGCEALVTAHPPSYLDYSTGVRCCADAAGPTSTGGAARERE